MKTGDTADVILNRLRPKTSQHPRRHLYLQNRAGAQHRRPFQPPRSTSTRSPPTPSPTWTPGPAPDGRHAALPELKDVATDQQNKRPGGQAGHRPRHRLAARRLRPRHRLHALGRLRPAPGLHHLHAAQPVPRRHGGGAEVPATTPRAQQDLRQAPPPARRSRSPPSPTWSKPRIPLSVNHQGSRPPPRSPSTSPPASPSRTPP
jgi:hypothetical protein